MNSLENRMDARITGLTQCQRENVTIGSAQEMADPVVMYVVCLAIIRIVVYDGTTVNVTEPSAGTGVQIRTTCS